MTRRLAFVIVGVVVTTLLLAGAGTLALAVGRARSATETDLRGQVVEIAAGVDELLDTGTSIDTAEGQRLLRQRLRLLGRLRELLPLDDVAFLTTAPDGTLNLDDMPTSLSLDDIGVERLTAGEVVSGTKGRTAFAAVAAVGPGGRQYIVVATRRVDAGLGPAVRLFLWAGAATILLGLAAAWLLGRRLTRPIRDVAAAAHDIAAGELSTRVEEPSPGQHDELAELQRSINHMASTLERSRGLEQQFLLSVSHDLRTPLTSIRGYAEAIADGAGDPKRAAAVIHVEARRLERLVADLLDLAKLQARAFTFRMAPVDVSAAVHTAVTGAAGSRPDVVFHPFTTGPLVVSADPDRLAQVLANLCENAGKYARSTVAVTARAVDGAAIVTVDDDGPGIADHDLPHVFERLYVARHVPERRENASGLGLAIVAELVGAMGGAVGAGSAPNGGARLWFSVPLG